MYKINIPYGAQEIINELQKIVTMHMSSADV